MDVGEEEYESDLEQAKLSLKMRRREASDDEEEEEEYHARGREMRINSRVSDCESDGQGAAAEYDNEESHLEDEHCGFSDAQGLEAHVLRKDLVERCSLGEKKDYEQTNVDQIGDNVSERVEGQGQEEKKENDPFAVPTAGAFYMHDDRFGDSVGGKHRQTLGAKNLWESRDDKRWGHDKFEEISMQERNYKEGRRMSRGHNRNQARGRNKGENHEHSQGNRPKAPRGKGLRMYQYAAKNNTEAPANNRGPLKSVDKASHANTAATSTSESSQFSSTKNNGLNSASPPFYPSGPSNKEIKRETYHPVTQSNNKTRKNVCDSLGVDKLYLDNSMKNATQQPLQARNKGRGQVQGQGQTPLGRMTYQPVPPHNQANRAPLPDQARAFHSTPVQVSSPTNLVKSTELASPLELNNSKMELVGKGKGDIRNNGMSLFPHGGMPTSADIGGSYGDQNFTGTPTFLPVMQFSGQHGGIGVPAVGMAFPGYVAQPNGNRNSEMTWLPVLAGAAGSLGAYHAWTAGQTSSLPPASSKDSNINEPDNKVKSEVANKELGQRQNRARRYTEMKFGQ